MPEQNEQTPNNASQWHALTVDDALAKVSSSRQGLSEKDAQQRREQYGPNALQQQRARPWWRRLLDQFASILIIILLIAGAASAALGEWVDAGAIAAVVLINAAVGFVQEGKAEKALDSIKNMLSPQAHVQREGKRRTISAEDVVPGDIVILKSGDRVPADVRLLEVQRLRTQEAPLTGESEAVDKATAPIGQEADLAERNNMAYAGTLVVQGTATGVVVATAGDTQIGSISEMLNNVEKLQTPLTAQLDRFGRVLAGVIIAVAVAMGAFGVVVHDHDLTHMFMAGVGLAVAAIPQGLPAIVTIALALGVQAMAKRNAIIRRLPAVETLGSVSTIFSDKTGTLTCNQMTAKVIALGDDEIEIEGVGLAPEGKFHRRQSRGSDARASEQEDTLTPQDEPTLQRFLLAGALCNDAVLFQKEGEWNIEGDPTEAALTVAAAKAGFDLDQLASEHERLAAIPFDAERKYMATLNKSPDDERHIYLKGAPDVVLNMCSHGLKGGDKQDIERDQWQGRIEALSAQGLRVLALAYKPYPGDGEQLEEHDVESELILLGLVGIIDPPREGVAAAIKKCQDAGIRVKMVTGDHALTASAIGAKLGLSNAERTMTGKELEAIADHELQDRVGETSIFARAAPEHKVRLVKATQAQKSICAMTGDGVNDAPALKRANVGVAMGRQGTEAAKEAAEMVLADDNFATIVSAVEEGRKVYSNITKTISFLLPTNGAESLAILLAVVAGTMLPVTPVQILWVNMVTAVTLGLALTFEPGDDDLMKRAPRDPNAPILNGFLIWRVLFVSVLLVAAVYGLFTWLRDAQDVSIELARSAAVNMLVMGEVAYLLNARLPLARSLSLSGLFGSRPALIAIASVVCLQLLWTYAPPLQALFGSAALSAAHWGVIVAAGVSIFLLVEIEKAVWRLLKAPTHFTAP